MYPEFTPKIHYDINAAAFSGMPEPLCRATAADGRGWSKGRYTKDEYQVSCKRCLKTLTKRGG